MVIDTTNKRLIYVRAVDLTPTETKIVTLLSDNRYHPITEITEYTGNGNTPKILSNLINKYNFLLSFKSLRGRGYKINNKIFIK